MPVGSSVSPELLGAIACTIFAWFRLMTNILFVCVAIDSIYDLYKKNFILANWLGWQNRLNRSLFDFFLFFVVATALNRVRLISIKIFLCRLALFFLRSNTKCFWLVCTLCVRDVVAVLPNPTYRPPLVHTSWV